MEAKLTITVKIPTADKKHYRSYEEELTIPAQRIHSDEPVKMLIDKIRERMRLEVISTL